MDAITQQAVDLLRRMIPLSSFSGEESLRCDMLQEYLAAGGAVVKRVGNNLIASAPSFDHGLPLLMLNSHIDTVKPVKGYTFDPFDPGSDSGVVRGLGSNDAGASVATMTETFLMFLRDKLQGNGPRCNLMLLLSAEEENSGAGGISLALQEAPRADMAIVGEPTGMRAAVAERGLLVLDGVAHGIGGHAARDEGVNALYIALEDIARLRDFRFSKTSPLMGSVRLTVTQIEAGTQHNVVPDTCRFVVDIRPTDMYTNSEIAGLLQKEVKSALVPRNLKNRSSATPMGHPLLGAIEKTGVESYVSPTTSDWMRLDIPAIKMGPGDSARSHAPDEYVLVSELSDGIIGYTNFINSL